MVNQMRMPILSYFLVVGSVLTGLLLWFGNESAPNATPISSQATGIAKFKPEPEDKHARATAVNFAAGYERPGAGTIKTADKPRQKTTNYSTPQRLNRFAEFPHDNLSIH